MIHIFTTAHLSFFKTALFSKADIFNLTGLGQFQIDFGCKAAVETDLEWIAANTTSTIAKFPYTLAVAIHSQSLQVLVAERNPSISSSAGFGRYPSAMPAASGTMLTRKAVGTQIFSDRSVLRISPKNGRIKF